MEATKRMADAKEEIARLNGFNVKDIRLKYVVTWFGFLRSAAFMVNGVDYEIDVRRSYLARRVQI